MPGSMASGRGLILSSGRGPILSSGLGPILAGRSCMSRSADIPIFLMGILD
jgi:hypothetical protein